MALYLENGVWMVWNGPYQGKTLASAIRCGTHLTLDRLSDWCYADGQEDIYNAEVARQRTWWDGCIRCGMRTKYNSDGCVECAAYDAEVDNGSGN